jgi:hypothetical protein
VPSQREVGMPRSDGRCRWLETVWGFMPKRGGEVGDTEFADPHQGVQQPQAGIIGASGSPSY